MLDIGLGQCEDCVLVVLALASTASNQGFKVELVKSNGRGNDVRKQKRLWPVPKTGSYSIRDR